MPRFAKFLATAGGVGYIPKAPGTAGSLIGLLLAAWIPLDASTAWRMVAFTGVALAAVAVSTAAERSLNAHDPACVVIDEVVGMWAVLLAFPALRQAFWSLALAFGLFRLFDILKPPPLKWLAAFPEGWGILLDDLGASAYTLGMLWLVTSLVGAVR